MFLLQIEQNVWLDCPLDVLTSNWFAKLSSYFVISLSFSCLCSKEHFCLSLPDHLTPETKFFYPCPIKHLHSIVLFFKKKSSSVHCQLVFTDHLLFVIDASSNDTLAISH
jgi:hypothetical protein